MRDGKWEEGWVGKDGKSGNWKIGKEGDEGGGNSMKKVRRRSLKCN